MYHYSQKPINNKEVFVFFLQNMFKWIPNIFNLFLFGNLFIALCSVSLIQSTIEQLGFSNNFIPYLFLVFFSTLFIYNLQRIFYKNEHVNLNLSIRRKWIFNNQLLVRGLALIGFLGAVITFCFNEKSILFYFFPLLLLSLAYFFPSIKLRKYPWIKIFTLSFVWTVVTAVIPILINPITISISNAVFHSLARFCFTCAICIPFDIRDFEIDSSEHVSTLPQLMGLNKAKLIALAFMLLHAFFVIMEFISNIFDVKIFIALLVSASITTILILFTNEKRSEYFYVFGIDGTMILQAILLLLVKHIY